MHDLCSNAAVRLGRRGVSLFEVMELFPDDLVAEDWLARVRWGDRIVCPHCDCDRISEADHHGQMRWRCRGCRKYFSVKTRTAMAFSNLGARRWVLAMYLISTNLKGVASTKLALDLGITQKSAWHMMHRVREAFDGKGVLLDGVVEIDETYIGGLEGNKHWSKKRRRGRGTEGKVPVVGAIERGGRMVAMPIPGVSREILEAFVAATVKEGAVVVTDDHPGYRKLSKWFRHSTVSHSTGEYVRGDVYTNTIESAWSMLKRGIIGIYHYMSPKHLHRYINEFTGRKNLRQIPILEQMESIAGNLTGKLLRYQDLISPAYA